MIIGGITLIGMPIILFLAFQQQRSVANFNSIPPPVYHYPAKTNFDIKTDLNIQLWELSKTIFFDTHYVGIKYKYLKEYNKWFEEFTWFFDFEYLKEAYDCDNFALLYKSLLSSAAYKKNVNREILVGLLVVRQEKTWGGIPNSVNFHALNLVYTDKGWVVIEPQSGTVSSLKEYPNPIIYYIF